MKKPLKILFLLMSLGLVVGCAGKAPAPSDDTTPSGDSGSGGESSDPSSDEPPTPKETCYTVFFFGRYITEEKIATLKTELDTILADFDNVVYQTIPAKTEDRDTRVGEAASAVAAYNTQHENKANMLLGFNGDSDNALANAGYQQYNEQNYTYGTDKSRKLWVEKEPVYAATNDAIQQYLFAHYGPTKVQLGKNAIQVLPGESATVAASLDIAPVGAELTFTAVSDKDFATVTIEDNQITVALSSSATVGEVATITVSCLAYTPATLAVTVADPEAAKENHLVVAFYNKFVTEAKRGEIEEGFAEYLTDEGITLDSVTFVALGTSDTNVAAFAGLITDYNGNSSHAHPINVLLGANGDSGNALANAGYKKESGTSYNYGTDNNRKIWVPTEYDSANPSLEIKTLIDYIVANYTIPPAA